MTLLFAAAALIVQPAPAHPAHHGNHATPAPAASTAPAQRFSVNTTTIRDLMANPAAKAVVDRHIPGFSADPRVTAAGGFTLKFIQPHSQGMLTDAMLTAIERDLAALPAS